MDTALPSRHIDAPLGDEGRTILVVLWTLAFFSILACVGRFYLHYFKRDMLGWDLFWISLCLAVALPGQSLATVGVVNGLGNHDSLLTVQQAQRALWSAIISIGFLLVSYIPAKIAIVAFLLRIQGPTHGKKGRILHFIAWTNAAINSVQAVLNFFQCEPVERSWNQTIPGSCERAEYVAKFGFFQGAWSVTSDLALAAYPIVVFGRLHMPIRLKIACFSLTSVAGLFSATCAGIKIFQIHLIEATEDRTHALGPLLLWGWLELWVIIIAGSLAPLGPLFTDLYRKARSGIESMTPPALGGSRSTSNRTDTKAPQSAVTADGSPAADSPGPNAIPLRPILRNRPRSESTDAILQSHQYEHPPPVQPFTREERLALAGYRGIAAYRELTVTEERVDDESK